MFGAIGGQLPVRLRGTPQNGVTAAQHARLCADWYAVRQTAPLAHFTWVVSGGVATITYYRGMNGSGLAYAPNHVTVGEFSGNQLLFRWDVPVFTDPYGVDRGFRIKHAIVGAIGGGFRESNYVIVASTAGHGIRVNQFNSAGTIVAPVSGYAVLW
jgi:hypothetical protein